MLKLKKKRASSTGEPTEPTGPGKKFARAKGEKGKKKEKRRSGSGRGGRLVLLVGEEGGVLVLLKKGKVIERLFSPGPTSPETESMSELARNTPKASLYVVFDTVDQSYVQQSLPPVSALSVNKLVKRRLERDFSGEYLKGAFSLGKDKGGSNEWQFMIAALLQTALVRAWINVIVQWPNPCRGLLLLPVETAGIITRLHDGIAMQHPLEDYDLAPWQFLVTYNKVSGIRQVIFHNGKLVLTRLTQPSVDATAESIAGTIEQEIISTKEYLKRMARQEQEAQQVLILASEDICKNIDSGKLNVDRVDVITPYQATEMLGLEGAAQPADRFGDSFLCAALGTGKKRQLVLTVPEMNRQRIYLMGLYAQRGVAACAILALLGYMGDTAWDVYTLGGGIDELQQKQAVQQQLFESLKKKSAIAPEDLDRIIAAAAVYEAISQEAYRPDSLLSQLNEVLAERVAVTEFSWQIRDVKPAAAPKFAVAPPPVVLGMPKKDALAAETTLAVDFPANLAQDPVKLEQDVTDVLNQLKLKLPNYQISYTSTPAMASQTDIVMTPGSAAPPKPSSPQATSLQARVALVGPSDTGEENAADQQNTKR